MFICLLLGGFSIGQAAPSLQDFSVALGAAGFIYDTIDRVSRFSSVVKGKLSGTVVPSNVCCAL